jgi:uncharacterized protein (DUF1697 family)
MPNHAAFLRGVNLGPKRRVSADELRSMFAEMGFEDVDAFRTSGNVVFGAGREARDNLAARIEKAMSTSLGFDVTVFLRTAAEVRGIAEHDPFPGASSGGKLQVTLLSDKPAARTRTAVLELATDRERLAFGERELYWLPSGGTRDSAPFLRAVGKLLGDETTMRTKQTVEKLAARYFDS